MILVLDPSHDSVAGPGVTPRLNLGDSVSGALK